MQSFRGFPDSSAYEGCVLAIGNFDGVHRGHQRMLVHLCKLAIKHRAKAVVMTFDPHPITLLRPEHTPPRLSTLERKLELLSGTGVDCTIAYPTDRELLNLSAEEFFDRMIRQRLKAIGLVEGPNFFFGKDRSGNIEVLRRLCDSHGLFLDVVEPSTIDGEMISSSRVRDAIRAGRLEDACRMLGHPYQVEGVVREGAQRGQTLGFPTANLEEIPTLLPAEGVYVGETRIEGQRYPVAINVGPNPTFDDERRKLEAHLVDFTGDLYGKRLKLDFLSEIREVKRFDSVEDLKQQLEQDIRAVRAYSESTAQH